MTGRQLLAVTAGYLLVALVLDLLEVRRVHWLWGALVSGAYFGTASAVLARRNRSGTANSPAPHEGERG